MWKFKWLTTCIKRIKDTSYRIIQIKISRNAIKIKYQGTLFHIHKISKSNKAKQWECPHTAGELVNIWPSGGRWCHLAELKISTATEMPPPRDILIFMKVWAKNISVYKSVVFSIHETLGSITSNSHTMVLPPGNYLSQLMTLWTRNCTRGTKMALCKSRKTTLISAVFLSIRRSPQQKEHN